MRRFLLTLTFLLTANVLSITADAQSAEQHFQRGRQLIESNCGECTGASKKGLEQGIDEVNKAIDMGYSDKIAAYELLADANNTLGIVYSQPGSKEEIAYGNARQAIYERLMGLDPQNVKFRYEYAMGLSDETKQMAALRDVLKLDPKYADAYFALGMILTTTGQVDEGIIELENAMRLESGDRTNVFGERLINILEGLGRKDQAEQIRAELKESAAKRAQQGATKSIINLGGRWKTSDGQEVVIEQSGQNLKATFVSGGDCGGGEKRDYYIQGSLSGNSLSGTMNRCTQNRQFLKTCHLRDPYTAKITATVDQNMITGKYIPDYITVDCKVTPGGGTPTAFSLTRMR